jgi:hypothetical protein
MPNTYTPIATTTLGSSISSYTFSSIPQTYTDIVLIANYGSTITEDYLKIQFNSDTSTNYSATRVDGNGSSARSTQTSNQDAFWVDWDSSCENAITKVSTVQVMNYTNSTTFKTSLVRGNRATATTPTYTGVEAMAVLWRKTPEAINSLELFMSSGNILAGSTFSLYGIANADQGAAKATGGMITEDSQYWYHTFGASGAFIPKQSLTCDVLVVAGGGGGGSAYHGSGGGAGGLRQLLSQSFASATTYTATVGAGGNGGSGQGSSGNPGSVGTNSSLIGGALSISASGGGGGDFVNSTPVSTGGTNGGSGGGRGYGASPARTGNVGSYTPVEGFAGGVGVNAGPNYGSGGGGGAGAVGVNGTSTSGGAGGIGATSSFINEVGISTGIGQLSSGNFYLAGGGGGSGYQANPGAGGIGGGGAGSTGTPGGSGIANTGGGGGGAEQVAPHQGGNGGSGIVMGD